MQMAVGGMWNPHPGPSLPYLCNKSAKLVICRVNVCGGQCCHGWTKAPGSHRCTKPNCTPKCLNGGMCLRPQFCVCKPGTKGKACEEKPSHGTHSTGTQDTVAQTQVLPQQTQSHRMVQAPQKMTLTVKQKPIMMPQHIHLVPLSSQPLMMTVQRGQSQQFTFKPKYYTQKYYPGGQLICLFSFLSAAPFATVGNNTGRIKVVFTPTICKVTCTKGKCHNSCEQGNTTTLISENGHAADTLTAQNFRVVVCHLPCMNGGECTSRDKCQCSPNFTGKFCHIPVQSANSQRQHHHQQQQQQSVNSPVVHSTHTLPLSFGVKFPPNIVNIHVKHPPEATVQIHQVSRVDSSSMGQKVKGVHQSNQQRISYHVQNPSMPQVPNSVYTHQQVRTHHYPRMQSKLGRCFQETTGSQCGKALPGLLKQEDCCGTVGTSWGFHKCQKCPKMPLIGNGQMVECPLGYKRVNATFCQDINECQLQGVCPHGECLNTLGSYRCRCKPGFVADPACNPENLLTEEKGPCYRFVSAGKQCLHPLSVQLSKQMCCCSVGKAWGPNCEKCPILGTAAFKEICPGGMGYHVSQTVKKVTVQPEPGVKVPGFVPIKNKIILSKPLPTPAQVPPEQAPVEAFSERTEQPEVVIQEGKKIRHNMFVPFVIIEVIEKTSPPGPVHIAPEVSTPSVLPHLIAATQVAEINECSVNPRICGPGRCINLPEGYTCNCDSGYSLSTRETRCIDLDECAVTPKPCTNAFCENTVGSFRCICHQGYMSDGGNQCFDIDECLTPIICGEGLCINMLGSYKCEYCDAGYRMDGGQCIDIDECQNSNICPSGTCINSPGTYECMPCPDGYKSRNGQCVDINECLDRSTCANGRCSNQEGTFICSCNRGYEPSTDGKLCEDVDECQDAVLCTNGQCKNTEASFYCECNSGYSLTTTGDQISCEVSEIICCMIADIDECQEDGDACQGGLCMNTEGSFMCVCPSGFQLVHDKHCSFPDVNECLMSELCANGECQNTEGSFYCMCEQGFAVSADGRKCEDVDECANSSMCGSHGYCENTAGAYRCICDQGFQDLLDGQGCADVNECEMISGVCGDVLCENVEGSFLCICFTDTQEFDPMTGEYFRTIYFLGQMATEEKKECYYNLDDTNFCDNVLASNITKEKCCCTLGAGWGDNCEIFPCPVFGTSGFAAMCPEGKGMIGNGDSAYGINADECALFGQEICKNGFCLNTQPGYECYCRQGLYYDPVKLQCLDIDECQDPLNCINGQCINTDGSYNCFCTHPMILDSTGKRCLEPSDIRVQTEEADVYQDICWQAVNNKFICASPLAGRPTTYTECCCMYGEAWGMNCALCPKRNTDDYAQLCNLPIMGRRFLPAVYNCSLCSTDPFQSFEGLQADECGILKGCENGRCVRVQEGYTCDCYDGYQLEMIKMECVDVDECNELNDKMSLCRNARCINTDGSYKCLCLRGYVPSEQLNYCVPSKTEKESELE
uniref:Latent-transforming growth factor beta-binding protein 1 n=1 Tax=Callorhinchus milii TaxID=7868 RepID=A0A4W3KIQ9_CALMI